MDSHDDDILGGENFSPNIKNLADEQEREGRLKAEQQEAAKKAKETVAIDGIAFHEDEIDYHSKNIQQKDGKDLCTKVEGAERRKREAEEEALKYAVTKKEAKERLERDIKHAAKENKEAELRRVVEAEKAKKKEREDILSKERRQAHQEARKIRSRKVKHTVKVLGILILIIAVITAVVWLVISLINKTKIENEQRLAEEEQVIEDALSFEEKLEQAEFLIDNNRIEEALPIYDELLKENLSSDERVRVYVHRSKVIYKSQDYGKSHREQAIEDANKAYEVDNNSTRALAWLIELYADLGKNDKAEEYQKRYDEIIKENAEKEKNDNSNNYGRG